MNQLHAFVEVALDTSDRDVVMCTKLSSLRTVGSAVGKLLFELPKSEGFFKLVAVCDDFLEGKSLPNLLVCHGFIGVANNGCGLHNFSLYCFMLE